MREDDGVCSNTTSHRVDFLQTCHKHLHSLTHTLGQRTSTRTLTQHHRLCVCEVCVECECAGCVCVGCVCVECVCGECVCGECVCGKSGHKAIIYYSAYRRSNVCVGVASCGMGVASCGGSGRSYLLLFTLLPVVAIKIAGQLLQ